jgi:hypothetical protein
MSLPNPREARPRPPTTEKEEAADAEILQKLTALGSTQERLESLG